MNYRGYFEASLPKNAFTTFRTTITAEFAIVNLFAKSLFACLFRVFHDFHK